MKNKIKYPLSEKQKQEFKDRLQEVLDRKDGVQVIILWDKKKLTDYYQNICTKHLIESIKDSSKEYSKITNNILIEDNL